MFRIHYLSILYSCYYCHPYISQNEYIDSPLSDIIIEDSNIWTEKLNRSIQAILEVIK